MASLLDLIFHLLTILKHMVIGSPSIIIWILRGSVSIIYSFSWIFTPLSYFVVYLSPFSCVIYCIWKTIEIMWGLEWCYLFSERIYICFWQMARALTILDYLNPIRGWNHLKLGLSIREGWFISSYSFHGAFSQSRREFTKVPESWTPVFWLPSLKNHLKIQGLNNNSKRLPLSLSAASFMTNTALGSTSGYNITLFLKW